jgi:tRNA pseudouridine55 synthase
MQSELIPTQDEVEQAIATFQGTIEQIPPMFSAKKVQGKKLYELARQGKEIERKPVLIDVLITLQDYTYPYLRLKIDCSKGTYIRSIAHDLGVKLGCGGHLSNLKRTRSGTFLLEECMDGAQIHNPSFDVASQLRAAPN